MENSIPVFIRKRVFAMPPILVHTSNVNDLEADRAPESLAVAQPQTYK
jgi:hypothetical protein